MTTEAKPTIALNQTVRFTPGPKSLTTVDALVVGRQPSSRGEFLITKDAAGVERKIRPGACTVVETKKAA